VALILFFCVYIASRARISIINCINSLLVTIFIAVYSIVFTPCSISSVSSLSLILLFILSYLVLSFDPQKFVLQIYKQKFLFYLIFLLSLIDYILGESIIGKILKDLEKYTMTSIFLEPSHAIIYALPFILISIESIKDGKQRIVIPNIFMFINLTSTAAVALIFANLRRSSFLFGCLIVVIFLTVILSDSTVYKFLKMYINEILLILVLSSESLENLTILVYLSGWMRSLALFEFNIYFGEGFNLMSCSNVVDKYQKIIFAQENSFLNLNDGSFMFSKIMSEFGVVSIIFLVTILLSIIILYKFRHMDVKPDSHWYALIVFSCFVMFLRNPGGYFTIPALLCLSTFYSVFIHAASKLHKVVQR
jgi:hypothetical protein